MKKLFCLFLIIFINTFFINAQAKKDKVYFIDTHNDVLTRQLLTGNDLAKEHTNENFDLIKAAKGNLAAQVFSIWCDETYGSGKANARANREIDSLYAFIKRNPDKIALATNVSELKKIIKQHKLAAMIGVEGGHMIEDRIDLIDSLHSRGMCYLTLTWNNSTSWATSAKDEVTKKDSLSFMGLTDKGKQIVAHLNELGVMIDVSHAGEKTFYDVLAASKKPVIASHSCSYTLNPHRRNLKDDQLKALAKNGGVVFVNFYNLFLDTTYDEKEKQFIVLHKKERDSLTLLYKDDDYALVVLMGLYKNESDKFRTPLSVLIKHIDYIVKLIGADHVGIGSDFDGAISYPLNMDDVSCYPLITDELKKLGYSLKDIRKITSGNFIRVLKANERMLY